MVVGVVVFLKFYFLELFMFEIKDVLLKMVKFYKGMMQQLFGGENKVDFVMFFVIGGVIDFVVVIKECLKMVKVKK